MRHQDQCPLPGCMSAWLPLVDVNEENGTIYIQPGSHKGELVTYWETLDENGKMDYEYRHKKTERIFEENNRPEDFHYSQSGRCSVISRSLDPSRGVQLSSLVPCAMSWQTTISRISFTDWPHTSWPRTSFDGTQRYTD